MAKPTWDLRQKTVLITRPQPGANETARQVEESNGQPLLSPALSFQPPLDTAPLLSALNRISSYDGVAVTSSEAARVLLSYPLSEQNLPPIFTVGPKTARPFQEAGLEVNHPQDIFSAQALSEHISQRFPQVKRVLFLRAQEGKQTLVTSLSQKGVNVELVFAYRAVPISTIPSTIIRKLERGVVDFTLFFSCKTARAFFSALPDPELLHHTTVVAISPITAKTVVKLGREAPLVPSSATSEAIMATLSDQVRT